MASQVGSPFSWRCGCHLLEVAHLSAFLSCLVWLQVESIKWLPGTRFIVDGFRFQSPKCQCYFLTHAHSDHTCGLTKVRSSPACFPVCRGQCSTERSFNLQSFSGGTIYCTLITGAPGWYTIAAAVRMQQR